MAAESVGSNQVHTHTHTHTCKACHSLGPALPPPQPKADGEESSVLMRFSPVGWGLAPLISTHTCSVISAPDPHQLTSPAE